MLKKVKIPRVVNYQTRAQEILKMLKECKPGDEGVEVSLDDIPRKDILQAAISREARREALEVGTRSIAGGLLVYLAT